MADTTIAKPILQVYATTGSKVSELPIKDGQLIYVHDRQRIALDFNGKRTFYNQITELETEQDRVSLLAPLNNHFYFVIETAILWRYFNGWKQLTFEPEEIVFIGVELPELGQPKTLYVNKTEGNEHISIWDEDSSEYKVVADKTQSMTVEEVLALFE